ncbi:hypothetical protein JOF28_001580 [Leucobacter exalbidus]|uniref:Uncharacterized protein n=1 Tax=Leucobacter exalbidus TaxID=662960 RepID=A0A940PND5_9MICO|nr:hypothetical protein [Leucobacter exalbidus]
MKNQGLEIVEVHSSTHEPQILEAPVMRWADGAAFTLA